MVGNKAEERMNLMSGLALKAAPSLSDAVKAVFSAVVSGFALVTAAIAAAHAVKSHRQPDEADLQALGMSDVSFKPYL